MIARLAAVAALLASTLIVAPIRAEEARPADPTKAENVARDAARPAEPLPVRQLHLAEQLAAHGRAAKDPLALIVAAQIRSQVAVRLVDRKPDGAEATAPAPTAPAPAAGDIAGGDTGAAVDALLAEAKALARNDPTIAALAADVKASATKGRVGGGVVSRGQITGRTIHNLTISFKGGQFAEIGVVGLDTGDMMLEVFDEGGHLICRDTDPAYCAFNPIWTGPFKVKVHNNGTAAAHYRLETN